MPVCPAYAGFVTTTTVRLPDDLGPILGPGSAFDVMALGARSGLLWCREGFAVAGIGEATRIPVGRPDGGAAAQAELAALSGSNELPDQPGTGAVGFGAFPFDRSIRGELIVPEIVVGCSAEGERWITTSNISVDDALQRVAGVMSRAVPSGPEPTSLNVSSVLAPEIWRDEVVGYAVDRINAGELEKVVLARELVVRTNHPVDTALIVDRLRAAYPAAIVFSIDGFVGASPELLVSRADDVVRAHPLAGTAPRAADPTRDANLAEGLLKSDKDRWEHQITIEWLLKSLLPFCSYVDAEPTPSIVTLANVHHLGTLVEGRLSRPAASVLELVETLHPTPAVGGDPQGKALTLIEALERADRGRYAGPAGWVDGAGNGAFAVSVRSAQFGREVAGPSEVHVFAGVGVVGDSDPQSELDETRSKFQAILGALLRP